MDRSLSQRLLWRAQRLTSKLGTAAVVSEANTQAQLDYTNITKRFPDARLSSAETRIIRAYAKDVLGSRQHAPGLIAYTAWRGEFREGWIPSSYFHSVLIPSWTPFHFFDRKTFIKRVLIDPPITDLAYFIRGNWLDEAYQPLPRETVVAHLFARDEHVFVKQDVSRRGLGVFRLARQDFDLAEVERHGDLVVQAPIKQHPWFGRFTPDSIATLRITTVKMPGLPARAQASYLRLARAGAELVRSESSIRVAIDVETGALSHVGVSQDWETYDAHPDSKIQFAGAQIPRYNQLVAFCIDQHDRTPISGLIGWDVTLDRQENPVLIEFNQGRANIAFTEAAQGPSFLGLGFEQIWRGDTSRA